METLSIPDLLAYLQSHPSPANFNLAAGILQSRHDSLLDDLTIKEVDLVELRSRCKTLERNLADQSSQLQESLTKAEDARKRAQTAEDKLDFFIQAHKDLYPDRIIQVSDSEDDAATAVVDAGVINLADDDDGKDHLPTPLPGRKRRFVFDSDSEDEGGGDGGERSMNNCPQKSSVPRRKRRTVVFQDGGEEEDEDDIPLSQLTRRKAGDDRDDIPLSQLMRRKAGDDREEEGVVYHPRQMIAQAKDTEGIGNRVSRSRDSVRRRIVFSDDEGDDENGDGLESEDKSLDGFIVENSSEPESNCSQDESDSDVELDAVLAKIHRAKDLNKWEYEADMLAAFAKDDELCMKAVCDLWRLQTDEEKNIKHVIVLNNRGFNKFDANRGSIMAEFLTDGDRDGPLKKTVQELEEFDPQGVKYCRKLAFHYSGQLFSLYKTGAEVEGI